jgi:hypothetical protein
MRDLRFTQVLIKSHIFWDTFPCGVIVTDVSEELSTFTSDSQLSKKRDIWTRRILHNASNYLPVDMAFYPRKCNFSNVISFSRRKEADTGSLCLNVSTKLICRTASKLTQILRGTNGINLTAYSFIRTI